MVFHTSEPIELLLGYFYNSQNIWLQTPDPETDAEAANQGGVEPRVSNAVVIPELPVVNVHVRTYSAGNHTLDFGPGSYLILGFVVADTSITQYDAGLKTQANGFQGIDWLLE